MSDANRLMSRDCADAVLSTALRIVWEIGIETNRQDLLEKVEGLDDLTVRGDRIHVGPSAVHELIEHPGAASSGLYLERPENPTITVPDRSTLIADHHARELRPLSRADVIAGTKLIDSLAYRCVHGNTPGTPQDTVLPLQPVEQYVIGFRYSRNGGRTPVPLTPEAARYLLEIREIAEDDFDLRRRSFSVWVPSPLKLEGNELDELMDSDVEIASFYVGSMPMMGLTGPVDPAGILTLSLAETLGGAAILHRLFPGAEAGIYPHPEPMDPRTGLMAFGTPEWGKLLLLEKEIREFLGMSCPPKENLTSACMPDIQAQADKMASICFGVTHGFTCFNVFPLCADEVWSHVQLALDVEYVHTAWETRKPVTDAKRAAKAFDTLAVAVREKWIPGEMEDTVLHLRENYYESPLPRVFSSGQWEGGGRPDPLVNADAYARNLIEKADYSPPEDRLRRIMDIYHRACREFGAVPMKIEG